MEIDERNIAGTRYSLIGRATSAAILFILSIIVARYLGPERYGELSLALTAIVFISVIIDAGLNRSTQKHISQYLIEDIASVRVAYKKILTIKAVSVIAASIALYIASPIFAEIFDIAMLEKLMKVGAVLLAATVIIEYHTTVLQGYEHFKHICLTNIFEAALKLSATALITYMGMGVMEIMLGYASSTLIIAAILTIIVSLYIVKPNIKVSSDKDLVREIINYSPPLFLSTLFFIFYTKFDILAIGYFGKAVEVGYYTLAIGLIDNLLIPIVAIEAAVMPIAASLYGKKRSAANLNRLFNQTINHGFFFMVPIISGLLVVSHVFVEEIYGLQFIDTALILVALSPFLFTKTIAVLNGAYLIAANEAKRFMKYTFGAVVLNTILLIILIPPFGVYGAVAAKITSHTILTASMLAYIIPRFEINIDKRLMFKNIKIVFSSISMAAICYILLASTGGLFGLIATIVSGVIIYILLLHISKTVSIPEMLKIAKGDLKLNP